MEKMSDMCVVGFGFPLSAKYTHERLCIDLSSFR